jgi:hypothetical protein
MTTQNGWIPESTPFSSRALTDEQVLVWSWPQLAYFCGAVLACFLLMLAIQYGNGYYNLISIRLLLGSVILSMLLIPALFWAQSARANAKLLSTFSSEALLLFTSLLLIFELILGLRDAYLHYNQNPLFPNFARGVGWLATLLVATYIIQFEPLASKLSSQSFWSAIWAKLSQYRFTIIILLTLILKTAVVFSSYRHFIDVGIMIQESSAHFLAGRNPYSSATAWLPGFIYLPAGLLLPLPFYTIFGDTRFGSIVWELIGIGFIYQIARAELSPRFMKLAEQIILLFMLQPRSLFVIEQAWIEPVIVGMIAVTLYFFYYRFADSLTDIVLAILLAIKQYLLFIYLPVFILYNFKWKRYAITSFIFSLILFPFFIWNPNAFYNQTVLHYLRIPIEPTSLGLTAYFAQQGIPIPRWISPAAAGLVAIVLGLLLKRFGLLGYLHTLILTFFCLFIFGQQAFANYYYLISFLQMTAIIFFLIYLFPHSNQPTLKIT